VQFFIVSSAMSSFGFQKSFEKSLRSSNPYQVPLIPPSKTEVHKGCTGKAHACGSIKSANTFLVNKTSSTTLKLKVKNDGKSLRKNSLSSETVSDSGSEISVSWNSNKASSNSSSVTPQNQPSPLKRTKSVNYGSTNGSANARRRTSDSVISVDVPDNVRNGLGFKCSPLLSNVVDGKKTTDVSKLRRSSSFRLKTTPPIVPIKPKAIQPSLASSLKRSGSLRSSLRSKAQIATWNSLWEYSLASKLGGGSLRVVSSKVLKKYEKVKNNKN
jgi:hypothetical protein